MQSELLNQHQSILNTFDSHNSSKEAIENLVYEYFDLRPKSIINMLDLRKPIYLPTAAYGHFGRLDTEFPWEKLIK
jgi:S-adenosylmethionine synthetase